MSDGVVDINGKSAKALEYQKTSEPSKEKYSNGPRNAPAKPEKGEVDIKVGNGDY